jgi:hypothetical protein
MLHIKSGFSTLEPILSIAIGFTSILAVHIRILNPLQELTLYCIMSCHYDFL